MGIQGEEECKRKSHSTQSKPGGKRIQSKTRYHYNEVFAPVARMENIQMIISLPAYNGWRIHQMDVKSTFINGYLKEDSCIEQPVGYIVE